MLLPCADWKLKIRESKELYLSQEVIATAFCDKRMATLPLPLP
jgi:hypothetical protein